MHEITENLTELVDVVLLPHCLNTLGETSHKMRCC